LLEAASDRGPRGMIVAAARLAVVAQAAVVGGTAVQNSAYRSPAALSSHRRAAPVTFPPFVPIP
jgi:hypothetical protein